MKNYIHLSLRERQIFYTLKHQGLSIRQIAKELNRHHSTLYREFNRHQIKQDYHPIQADKQALATRTKTRKSKIERYNTLQQYVMQRLREGWSPEQIAGRLKRKKSKYVLCHSRIVSDIDRFPE